MNIIKRIFNPKLIPAIKKHLFYESFTNLNADNGLEKFKNKYTGQRCFILATGPSIQKQDLSLLKGEKCISVSMFYLHDLIQVVKPIWHVFAPTHPPFQFDTASKIFDSCYESYKDRSDIRFFIGHRNYKYSYRDYFESNESKFYERFNQKIHWVDYSSSEHINEVNQFDDSVWDPNNRPFEIRTVIYSAIQLAYHLGFREVVLVGCDHDYLIDTTRKENHHFYSENRGFSDKDHLSAFTTERWFLEYYNRWREFRLMREFFESKNRNIINSTEGGLLDVFPRRKLESFLI